jgi:hypothetical protein
MSNPCLGLLNPNTPKKGKYSHKTVPLRNALFHLLCVSEGDVIRSNITIMRTRREIEGGGARTLVTLRPLSLTLVRIYARLELNSDALLSANVW